MKKCIFFFAFLCICFFGFTQTDSTTKNEVDTVIVGVYKIPNKTYSSSDDAKSKNKKITSDIIFGKSNIKNPPVSADV